MRNDLRTAVLAALIGYLACVPASAQAPAAATIRCAQCSLSGQKPDTSAADLSRITFVEQLEPVFALRRSTVPRKRSSPACV
jgi:hypothetical protein